MHVFARFLLVCWVTLCFQVPAQAASYDPDLEWKTLRTDHFNITFHQGEEALAEALATTAERVHILLTEDMDHQPNRATEVVLVDHTDVANGYAQTLPVNTIVIYVTAPTESSSLGLYEDWLEAIFTHEYAHILHLDTVEGIPSWVRKVLGRIVSVNQVSPWWIVEGLATYQETRFTTGGRGRAPAAQMMIRMSILEDQFPELGQMDGWISDPPGGNLRYLFGQSFLQYIADHSSEDAWTRWTHSYGSWIPYLLPAKQVFGKSFRALYQDWKAHLEEVYGKQREDLESAGLTTFEVVSDGEDTCYGPVFSPDGKKLVFSCSDRAEGSDIWVLEENKDEPEVLLEGQFAKTLTWRSDSQAFAYSKPHSVGFFNLYDDVYFHQLGSESAKALTAGRRARDPAFSPDGSDLLMVRNQAQNNNLIRMRIDQSVEKLTDYSDHTQLSTPRFSPNGQFLVLSKWQDGYRDLWLYDKNGTPYRRLTADTHIDRDPVFSADGSLIYFSSDRTGIPNLYAIDLTDETVWQVTNVLGGAFQPSPSPDSQTLAFQSYSTNGYDIARMPIDRDSWKLAGVLHRSLFADGDIEAVVDATPGPQTVQHDVHATAEAQESGTPAQEDDSALEEETSSSETELGGHRVDPYSPLGTLFPPRFVMPGIYQGAFGFMGVLSTGGVDTLRKYGYSGYLTYRTDAKYLGGGGSFTINRWLPVVGLSANTYAVPYGDIYIESPSSLGSNIPGIESAGFRYWDRRIRTGVSVGYPLRSNLSAYARWTGTHRGPLHGIPENTYRPFLPTRGFLSQLGGSLRWARGGANTYSISPEGARLVSFSGKLTSSLFGSYVLNSEDSREPFDQVQITAEIREYLDIPWFGNHVLALRAAGGVSFGDRLRYGSFRLGGNYGESSYYVVPDEYISLRGWPIAAASGDWYYLSSAEYRFPIWRVDRGTGTLPLFFRTLHGAVFADAGSAFDDPNQPEGPLLGTGTELRMTGIVGWGLPLQARLGYAFALFPSGGISPNSPASWYFRLGTSF